MHFSHHPEIWSRFPELAAGVLHARGIRANLAVDAAIARFNAVAQARLEAAGAESELPEVQAWRRAFSRMGMKPTQYRCASESLLRRFKKEAALPRLHPLVDLCNAASLAFAIPVAALDVAKVAWPLQVRPAEGGESYLSFGGEVEHPEPGEVSFVDAQGQAHARRWTHRQSGLSAVRDDTAEVLIVAEALHAAAREDAQRLATALEQALGDCGVQARSAVLHAAAPRFEFE
ncbi:MAG TPA: phenylalanine--tRNA ligase beta subunit-related protein [Ramlibacter sp.]|nr:phenylalanine--tRNA ligase beta subunit-related protein [Ramlibacter sp.]